MGGWSTTLSWLASLQVFPAFWCRGLPRGRSRWNRSPQLPHQQQMQCWRCEAGQINSQKQEETESTAIWVHAATSVSAKDTDTACLELPDSVSGVQQFNDVHLICYPAECVPCVVRNDPHNGFKDVDHNAGPLQKVQTTAMIYRIVLTISLRLILWPSQNDLHHDECVSVQAWAGNKRNLPAGAPCHTKYRIYRENGFSPIRRWWREWAKGTARAPLAQSTAPFTLSTTWNIWWWLSPIDGEVDEAQYIGSEYRQDGFGDLDQAVPWGIFISSTMMVIMMARTPSENVRVSDFFMVWVGGEKMR